MRKLLFLTVCLGLAAPFGAAAQSSGDIEGIGNLAGAIMACGAHKPLYQFEEILSRYFSNTSPNQAAEEALMRRYATAKVSTYMIQRNRSKQECPQTVSDFTRMDIFKFELYSDGSLKTPDGKYLFPRGQKKLAADAVKIYPRKKR